MDLGAAISDRLAAACRDGTTSGAACVVLRAGRPAVRAFHGTTRRPDLGGGAPVGPETFFEVASLTKVMATTAIAMSLSAEGRLDLDAPVRGVLPGLRAGFDPTFADLLAHRSGLPAWRPYWERAAADPVSGPLFVPRPRRVRGPGRQAAFARAREHVLAQVLAETQEHVIGARAVYCDAGFILLGRALEILGGGPLEVLFDTRVAGPLGLRRSGFVREDGPRPPARPAPVAATRPAPARGGAVLEGEVDDDNAFALGGVAGHAGLFAAADDVAAFGEAVRRAAAGEAGTPFDPATVRRFLTRDRITPGSVRALGWDMPSGEDSHAGRVLSRERSFGHLGFTGCSLWIDLSRDLVVALLTNRVHAEADAGSIRRLRADVHDLAAHLAPSHA